MQEYDPATDAWKNIVFSAPQAKFVESGAASYTGQIFLIGGDKQSDNSSANRFDSFDPASKSWSQSAPLLQPASQMQAHVIGQSVVVAGGSKECHHGCDPGAEKTVQVYSIADSAWQLAAEMPEPRLGYASAVVEDKLYLFGGTSKRTGLTNATIHANTYQFTPPASVTSVATGSQNAQPKQFALQQNHPNPFNPSTTIQFALAKRATATLTVFDILGREVAVLVDEALAPGTHEVVFDANGLASGVYVYRLQAGALVQTKKLMLLR